MQPRVQECKWPDTSQACRLPALVSVATTSFLTHSATPSPTILFWQVQCDILRQEVRCHACAVGVGAC